VYCRGRSSGDTLLRSNQKTDANGNYQFGLWAGNRNTDSTYYWIIAEKSGYITDTVGFWVKRNQMTWIPNINMCPGISGTTAKVLMYPNPTNQYLNIELDAHAAIDAAIDVYDVMGRKVYSRAVSNPTSTIDLSELPDGLYQVSVSQSWGWRVIGDRHIIVRK
jgi:hypothetical protein